MAIGLGLMLGFVFAKNFDCAVPRESITEFWQRWHISLSTWLRDYLYVPLGGNRKAPGRTYVNLAIVMLLGGLWHGAAWTFVDVGCDPRRAARTRSELRGKAAAVYRLPAPVRVGLTFTLVLVTWVFFRAADVPPALATWATCSVVGRSATARRLLDRGVDVPAVLPRHVPAGRRSYVDSPQTWDWTRTFTFDKGRDHADAADVLRSCLS